MSQKRRYLHPNEYVLKLNTKFSIRKTLFEVVYKFVEVMWIAYVSENSKNAISVDSVLRKHFKKVNGYWFDLPAFENKRSLLYKMGSHFST